jgi:murein DD-endopeptidase MepM/ murein hydrolase activator NlpD
VLKRIFRREIIKKELKSVVHKNNNKYTFLLSHSSKSSIYIRRIEISKNVLHTSSFASLFLIIGIVSLGLFGLIEDTTLAKSNILTPNEFAIISSQTSQFQNNQRVESKVISYENNGSTEDYTINSGGPLTWSQLTESDGASNSMELALRRIETTSGQEFIPRTWSHLGKINNEFGYRRNPFGGSGYEFHAGMDIDGERGDAVIAAANGIIVKAEWQGGYGNMIEIDHGNGLTTRYGHLAKIETQAGDMVQRGQLIGFVGSTGRSTGPHLHYELRLNDKSINPRRFLASKPIEITQLTKK